MAHSTGYIIGFSAAVCLVCSVFVAGSAIFGSPDYAATIAELRHLMGP